jgi:hypothetical protein
VIGSGDVTAGVVEAGEGREILFNSKHRAYQVQTIDNPFCSFPAYMPTRTIMSLVCASVL